MVPLPGNTMVQTRSNQIGGSGCYHDSIATKLEIILEKLDSLLSLKNDIAAIREAWLARPAQLTKEPEDEPHGPLPDPVKEEDSDDKPIDGEVPGDIIGDENVRSENILGVVQVASRPCSEFQNKKTFSIQLVVHALPLNTKTEGLDQILELTGNHPRERIEVRIFSFHTKSQITWGQGKAVGHGQFKEQPMPPEVQRTEGLQKSATLKKPTHTTENIIQNRKLQPIITHHWVFDPGQPDFTCTASSRLEDKSCLRAGSIDTNPNVTLGQTGLSPTQLLLGQRVDPTGSNRSRFSHLDPVKGLGLNIKESKSRGLNVNAVKVKRKIRKLNLGAEV